MTAPSFAIGDIVETIKGAKFWGRIIALDTDLENPGCTVLAIDPAFAGTKHVYPLKQLGPRALPDSGAAADLADWSSLPKDIYVVSAKSHSGIAFDVVCCSVPMVTAPEVRYTRADLAPEARITELERSLSAPDSSAAAGEPIMWAVVRDNVTIVSTHLNKAHGEDRVGAGRRLVALYDHAASPVPSTALVEALTDIAAERKRQVEVEGWTAEHDDTHKHAEMAIAAMGYLQAVMAELGRPKFRITEVPNFWPWDRKWWKPAAPRRNLVKAGALIVAEIERLDRTAALAAAAHGRGTGV